MIVGVLPKPPRFLEIDEVLTLQESAVDEYGGTYGVRELGLLEAAVNMPRQAIDGAFTHEIPFGMAAAYAFHICKNHPFVDGNKRTALAVCIVFLRLNGWELHVPDLGRPNGSSRSPMGASTKHDSPSGSPHTRNQGQVWNSEISFVRLITVNWQGCLRALRRDQSSSA